MANHARCALGLLQGIVLEELLRELVLELVEFSDVHAPYAYVANYVAQWARGERVIVDVVQDEVVHVAFAVRGHSGVFF